MSNKIPALALQIANDIEPLRSWENITSPADFVQYIARTLTVDPNQIIKLQEVVFNSIEPSGSDRGKLWIKTDNPIGIGIPSGPSYLVIYKYPPDIPLLWTKGRDALPNFMEELTEGQMADMGLTVPPNTSYFYVIFREQ